MRWLFVATASAIAFVYYVGTSMDIKNAEKLNKAMVSTLSVLTGRNKVGTFAPYPGSWLPEPEEEDDTPYYFPPGLPKEEPYQEIGYLR